MIKLYDYFSGDSFITYEHKTGKSHKSKSAELLFVRSLLIFMVLFVNCNPEASHKGVVKENEGKKVMSQEKIENVLEEHTEKLMSLPGVVGTGQGLCDGKPCIKVFVIQLTPELEAKIPDSIKGYKVEAVETGQFQVFPEKETID